MEKKMLFGFGVFVVMALAGCGAKNDRGGAGQPTSGPGTAPAETEEAYVPTDRCTLSGSQLLFDSKVIYDAANLDEGDIGGSALSKYNLLKHAGACTNGLRPRCNMEDGFIRLDDESAYLDLKEGKTIARYVSLINSGACEFNAGDRCKKNNYHTVIDGVDAWSLGTQSYDLHMDQFEKLIKAGGCIKANSQRCKVENKKILKDGVAVFETNIELERSEKFIEMVTTGQCK